MSWLNTNLSPGIFYQFRKLAVINDKVWVIASGDAPVFHSTNFCESWNVIDTINCYPPSVMFSVAFANEMTGWTGGTFGWLYKTTDGGYNWQREETTSDPRFWGSIYCYNDSNVWGAGGAGKIQHTTTGGQTLVGISNSSSNSINNYALSQNYPNPFNPVTKIKYDLPIDGNVTIKIFDISGRLINTLVNEYKAAGRFETDFHGENLSSGVYYYRIESGEFSQVKKMILIK